MRRRAASLLLFATAATVAVIATAVTFVEDAQAGAPGFWIATGAALLAWGFERRAG
ncbi:hypothetical protein [Streptomyces sp. NBC_00299]|uniref:hypothetical protein n=1 Tax=Streptomyces sp. NBC_00299 TaxID=2975705 RepID=UPI002E2DB7F2|nr:hypothetical protein [Streptomyces sp. NBC_00299]